MKVKCVPPPQDMHGHNKKNNKGIQVDITYHSDSIELVLDTQVTNGTPMKVLSDGKISNRWYC
jgi:hypothetical protein